MTQDMREALTAAFDSQEKPDDETSAGINVAQGEEQHNDPEDIEGKEAGSAVSSNEEGTEKPESVSQAAENKDASQSAAAAAAAKAPETVPGTTHRVDRAPASWKKEAKGEWAALPLQARQEIHRREMEVQRVLNETAPARKEIEEFRGVVAPFMARIQSLGVTPNQAVGHLLSADYAMATGTPQQKAQFIDKLLQDYNVDIVTLDQVISARLGGQPQQSQQQPQAPDIQALVQQQLQQALAPLYQQQQAQQRQVQEQAVQTVEQMSLDPKYPYFEEVREKMAVIFESGLASDLPSAYKYAVSMTPELSAMTQATQLNSRAQRAAAAGMSVSGNPVGGGQQVHVSGGSLREDIEAAFGGASNRV